MPGTENIETNVQKPSRLSSCVLKKMLIDVFLILRVMCLNKKKKFRKFKLNHSISGEKP